MIYGLPTFWAWSLWGWPLNTLAYFRYIATTRLRHDSIARCFFPSLVNRILEIEVYLLEYFQVRVRTFFCPLYKCRVFAETPYAESWILLNLLIIWATSWENMFLPHATNKGADQPAHPRSLISTFVVRCLVSIKPLVAISEMSSLYLASVAAQTGLSLTLSQTPKTGFLVMRLISYSPLWQQDAV